VRTIPPRAGTVPPFARHTLVWLDPSDWRKHLLAPPDGSTGTTGDEALTSWIAAGRPAVVCRREAREQRPTAGPDGDSAAASSEIRLGVALPPRSNPAKRRVAFVIKADAVRRTAPPLQLDDKHVIQCAPAGWRALLQELCARGAARGITWRVFGSLSWQCFGDSGYLTATSDLDLLWQPRDVGELDAGLNLLQRLEAESKYQPVPLPRLDGEIIFPHGRGVSWREWAAVGGSAAVLVKSADAVTLQARGALRESLLENTRHTGATADPSPHLP
jgi:phosphoribosyl-dephospho-CoA transferase